MMTAKLFENGRSQAVRLPKEYRFKGDEVRISKIGEIVMLFPNNEEWSGFLEAAGMFSEDFLVDGRPSQDSQVREEL